MFSDVLRPREEGQGAGKHSACRALNTRQALLGPGELTDPANPLPRCLHPGTSPTASGAPSRHFPHCPWGSLPGPSESGINSSLCRLNSERRWNLEGRIWLVDGYNTEGSVGEDYGKEE